MGQILTEIYKVVEEKGGTPARIKFASATGLPLKDASEMKDKPELIELFRHIDIPLTTAVLFRKPRSLVTPDIWLRDVSDSSWVVFPWECPGETPNRYICDDTR